MQTPAPVHIGFESRPAPLFQRITMDTGEYIFVDLETTGLPKYDRWGNPDWSGVFITEIGALYYADGLDTFPSAKFQTLTTIPAGADYPEKVQQISGISRDDVIHARPFGSAIEAFADWVRDCNALAPWVGQNLYYFDGPLLTRALHDIAPWSLTDIELYGSYDTKLIWKAWCLGMTRDEYERVPMFWGRVQAERLKACHSLQHIARTYGIESEQAHRATDDCALCADVFYRLCVHGITRRVLNLAQNPIV